jgi:hypothetical protein
VPPQLRVNIRHGCSFVNKSLQSSAEKMSFGFEQKVIAISEDIQALLS